MRTGGAGAPGAAARTGTNGSLRRVSVLCRTSVMVWPMIPYAAAAAPVAGVARAGGRVGECSGRSRVPREPGAQIREVGPDLLDGVSRRDARISTQADLRQDPGELRCRQTRVLALRQRERGIDRKAG